MVAEIAKLEKTIHGLLSEEIRLVSIQPYEYAHEVRVPQPITQSQRWWVSGSTQYTHSN